MVLLSFARGPALTFALSVFVLGIGWRLFAILRRPAAHDLSQPRVAGLGAVGRGMLAHLWPRKTFPRRTLPATVNAYAYHIGLAVVVFGFVPHIAFVKRLTGLSWPAVPGWVFGVAATVMLFGLLFALMLRFASPPQRVLSGFDDYASWALTVLPFLTGMAAIYLPLDASYPVRSEHPVALAIHLLSFELLLLWFPFGKLSHAFLLFASRGVTAAALTRKGAAL